MKEIIYVAGKYRGNFIQRIINIWKARQEAKKLWRAGYIPIVPHLNSCMMDGVMSDQCFLDGTLQMLSLCDSIYMMKGYSRSKGAMAELEYAKETGKIVRYYYEEEL